MKIQVLKGYGDTKLSEFGSILVIFANFLLGIWVNFQNI